MSIFSTKNHNVVLKCCIEWCLDTCLETAQLVKGGGTHQNPRAESVAVQRCTAEQTLVQCRVLSSKLLKKQGSLGFICSFSFSDVFLLVFQGLLFKTCGFIALGRIG